MEIARYISFLFGAIRREQNVQYESDDISNVAVLANWIGSNWRTEIETHGGDSIAVYFRASE